LFASDSSRLNKTVRARLPVYLNTCIQWQVVVAVGGRTAALNMK